jgi:hypothetical protein
MRLLMFVIRSRPSPEAIVVGLCAMLLLAVAVPAMLQIREHARRHSTQNQLQQLGISFQSYHETFLSFPSRPATKSTEANAKPSEPSQLVSPLMILGPTGRYTPRSHE